MKNHWRPVSSRLWQDQTIRSLSRDAQILYFYLLTCEANTGLGIFYAPIPLVAYETNVPLETISDLLSELSGLAVFDEDSATWFVPETGRQELTGLKASDKRKIGIINELRDWVNHRFYNEFCEVHADLLADSVNLLSPSEALKKPLPSRKRNRNTNSKENSKENAKDEPAAQSATSTLTDPIKIFFELTEQQPYKPTVPLILQTVGTNPDALSLWRQVIQSWLACGWSPTNAQGMLEYFGRGEIPGQRHKNRNGSKLQLPVNEIKETDAAVSEFNSPADFTRLRGGFVESAFGEDGWHWWVRLGDEVFRWIEDQDGEQVYAGCEQVQEEAAI